MTLRKKKTGAERWPRTISAELHAQWKALYRKGDHDKLVEALKPISKPTIVKAVTYGHVHQDSIKDGITNYFASRIINEQEDAKRLQVLQDQSIKNRTQAAVTF